MKLNPKKNGSGKMTSFTINVSKNEAIQLGWFDSEKNTTKELTKKIINNKLIIEEAFASSGRLED